MYIGVYQLIVTFEALNGNNSMFVFIHTFHPCFKQKQFYWLWLVFDSGFLLIPFRKITHPSHIVLTKCIVVLTQFINIKEISL